MPTPKPPAITIFTAIGSRLPTGRPSPQGARPSYTLIVPPPQPGEQALEEFGRRGAASGARRRVHGQHVHRVQVGHEHAGHPERDPELRRHLDHRDRRPAHVDDAGVLEPQRGKGREALVGGADQGLECQVARPSSGSARP